MSLNKINLIKTSACSLGQEGKHGDSIFSLLGQNYLTVTLVAIAVWIAN